MTEISRRALIFGTGAVGLGLSSGSPHRSRPVHPDAHPAAATAASMGFNWPNAVTVYVNGWNQQSVLASDPSRPFRTARANGATVMRTMFGTDVSVGAVLTDPATGYGKLGRILGDAAANGVRLVLSNYLTLQTIEAVAGRTYPSWAAAQIDLTTPGSAAWYGFSTWVATTVATFSGNPGVYSWEVTNEAGWMLGMDAGTISVDTGLTFIDHFQGLIRSLGGRVNQGGRPSYDMPALTDAQVLTMVRNLDILDDHIYPSYSSSGAPIDDRAAALDRIQLLADLQARAGRLGHHLPAMLGEYGTLTAGWFDYVTRQAMQRGWLVLPWGFDSYDQFAFNETTNTHVLATIRKSTAGS